MSAMVVSYARRRASASDAGLLPAAEALQLGERLRLADRRLRATRAVAARRERGAVLDRQVPDDVALADDELAVRPLRVRQVIRELLVAVAWELQDRLALEGLRERADLGALACVGRERL